MRKTDADRVQFFSIDDMAGGLQLLKGEEILRSSVKSNYTDINDVLEFYHIKKYIDNKLYLKNWTQDDINSFTHKVSEYGKVLGRFMSTINDGNFVEIYEQTLWGYRSAFWEIVNNQHVFKRISQSSIAAILSKEPYDIHEILTHKNLVEYYNVELKKFLITYSKTAEILLSVFEVKDDLRENGLLLPKSLSVEDKENIISRYLDSNDVHYNYIGLIQNTRNRTDFKISDKTRLKAKRLLKSETDKFFAEKNGIKYGVTISFPRNASKVKDGFVDDEFVAHYSYSMDFIEQNSNPYLLFQNFTVLFEYLDGQKRLNLVSKKNKMNVFERIMGVHSQNEYRGGTIFNLSEMTSSAQMVGYCKVLDELNTSMESIMHYVFTVFFMERYDFAGNASFTIPSATSYLEKVRLLAPEFESVLKQYKLYVEEGSIDFELLQMSSLPTAIKDIPSLNRSKHVYFNEENNEMASCRNLFFSDQTLLTYVEPFKEKNYRNFFELLASEQVRFDSYEEHQRPRLDYLMDRGYIAVDGDGFVQITNPARVIVLKDLYSNEVASFYRYSAELREEVLQMEREGIILFGDSLFSKPEQAYFNYFLNKSEFTNGLDLRNSYLHGTQASPDEREKHEYAYHTYLKLLILTLLKIEDDLVISKFMKDAA